jgi:hypothetical protein
MKISKVKHKVNDELGKEVVIASGMSCDIRRFDANCIRLTYTQSRLEHDPPTSFLVELNFAEIDAIIRKFNNE